MIQKLGTALLAVFVLTSTARAAVFFALDIDPTTTAGPGSSSTRFGVGTWHLFAFDNSSTDFGISSFDVTLSSTAPMAVNNRSPQTNYDGDGDTTPVSAGFSFLRQTQGNNTSTVRVAGSQYFPPSANSSANVGVDYFPVSGFGQSASSFAAKYANTILGPTTGSSWGNYPLTRSLNSLFLAEGTYIGSWPTFGPVSSTVYTDFSTSFSSAAPAGGTSGSTFCLDCVQVHGATINNVVANDPGMVMATLTASSNFVPGPYTWSFYHGFSSYQPAPGATGTGPVVPPTIDPVTGKFSWNTLGSPLGTYSWTVTAENLLGGGIGNVTVKLTAVPEPAVFSLISLATLVALVAARRVRALT